MHAATRTALVLSLLLTAAAASAHAQSGRADLRYVAPLPSAVLFTTIDTIESTMNGLPTGSMTTRGSLQSTSELRFDTGSGDVVVTATLKEMSGQMSSPMGSMPIDASEGTPMEMPMDAMGPDPEMLSGVAGAAGMGGSPGDIMGASRAVSGLMRVPGRELAMGGTWSDTVTAAPTVEGMTMNITMVTRGTYESDSVVDGRTLNVLRITSELTSKSSGNVQGMDITQDMKATTEELVLWDSALHLPVFRDGVTSTNVDMFMPLNAMNMTVTGRTRSITTAEPQG